MALDHLAPGEVADIRPFGARIREAVSSALFKSPELEVMRLVLHAGQAIPPHAAPGDMTVQCLEGTAALRIRERTLNLPSGHLARLARGTAYDIRADTDCSLLVTIAMPPD
jgi:quercetin dioxygenase-like cupin family protein